MADIIIKNGTVIDGKKNAPEKADVLIDGGVIKGVGNYKNKDAERVIDANGKYVVPGFIDIHSHSDGYWTIFQVPGQESAIAQGVTTILCGNDGSSIAPLARPEAIETIRRWVRMGDFTINWMTMGELYQVIENMKPGVNFASLIGHTTIRRGLLGDEKRDMNKDEMAIAKDMIHKAMKEGGWGFSTGLTYSHVKFTKPEEIQELCGIVSEDGGIYATHMRDEGERIIEAVKEALKVSEKTGVGLVISHLKAKGKKSWPLFDEALKLIEDSYSKNPKANFSVYPYTTTGSVLYAYLPLWASEGGRSKMLERLKDPDARTRIVKEMEKDGSDYSNMIVSICPFNKALVGKKIVDMGREEGLSSEQVVINTLIAGNGHVIVFDKTVDEENMKKAVIHPLSMVASSGAYYNAEWGETSQELVHPRSFGAFPRFLKQFVVDEKLLDWPEAIHKITGMPAEKMGLKDRGFIEKGKVADMVVLDPNEIEDLATFENPYQYPKGVELVVINGGIASEGGVISADRFGKALSK